MLSRSNYGKPTTGSATKPHANGDTMILISQRSVSLAAAALACLFCFCSSLGQAQPSTPAIKNIVLVHGAFADATSWSKVIPLLEIDGYHVVAVQNPLTSLAADVAATKRAVARQDGPVLLVAHSWGGVTVTQAGDDPKVAGLVYVSAYAPDVGQSANDASSPYGWTDGQKEIRLDSAKFALVTSKGVSEDIAECLSAADQGMFNATQVQTYGPMFDEKLTVAAWKSKPAWVLVSSKDRMLPPAMEMDEVKRLNAVATMTIPTCHMSIIEQAAKVAAFIETAAKSAAQK
jgi:pimeloyl-ACP methyl ester carboxylesterase